MRLPRPLVLAAALAPASLSLHAQTLPSGPNQIKRYIESQIDDPELSVNSIANGCGVSVRSIHRAFASDPAGSVSKYIWLRRLSHCAAALRDPGEAQRPITEVCISWGFKSTSHFSRLFRERFGVPPREYRPAFSLWRA